jgi:hypothetical protein
MEYPEHEKLHKIKDQSQAIGEFLDWLQSSRHVILAEYPKQYKHTLVPIHMSTENILAEYFGINLNVLETEKRIMLDELKRK